MAMTYDSPVLDRASHELRCPEGALLTAPRADIAPGVIDVAGCEQVARYYCFVERYGTPCVREPDPSPAERAALLAWTRKPQPAGGVGAPDGSEPGLTADGRRMCRDRTDFDEHQDCVMPRKP
ncbi:MAG TPA: hypothetical protein VMU50_13415 [Polyangia bacterium]|nr:hypothetical protein [Polyangia bacterium]